MASICNDDWASLGVMSGHERKTLRLSVAGGFHCLHAARILRPCVRAYAADKHNAAYKKIAGFAGCRARRGAAGRGGAALSQAQA